MFEAVYCSCCRYAAANPVALSFLLVELTFAGQHGVRSSGRGCANSALIYRIYILIVLLHGQAPRFFSWSDAWPLTLAHQPANVTLTSTISSTHAHRMEHAEVGQHIQDMSFFVVEVKQSYCTLIFWRRQGLHPDP